MFLSNFVCHWTLYEGCIAIWFPRLFWSTNRNNNNNSINSNNNNNNRSFMNVWIDFSTEEKQVWILLTSIQFRFEFFLLFFSHCLARWQLQFPFLINSVGEGEVEAQPPTIDKGMQARVMPKFYWWFCIKWNVNKLLNKERFNGKYDFRLIFHFFWTSFLKRIHIFD